MMSQPMVISAGNAANYFSKDDYFMRTGEGYWHGKLQELNGVSGEILNNEYNRIVGENEITRSLCFRFSMYDSVYKQIKENPSLKPIANRIHRKAIENTIHFIEKKHPRIKFERRKSKYTDLTNFKIEIDQRKNKVIATVRTNELRKKNCGFYDSIVKDRTILEFYNKEMVHLLNIKKFDFSKEDFEKTNGSIRIAPGRFATTFTLSMPKSCSIAMYVDNKKYHQAIIECHQNAIKETLNIMESNQIFHKRYKNNKKQLLHTDRGVLFGVFDHYTSRNQDPQTHSHVLVFNNIRDKFGKIARLENKKIFENYILSGQIYRSELNKLLNEKGFSTYVSNDKFGFFELAGIPKEAIEKFSTRRNEIVEKLKDWGVDHEDARLSGLACYLTRKAKEEINFDILVDSWQKDFVDLGLDNINLFSNIEPKMIQIENTNSEMQPEYKFSTKEEFLNYVLENLSDSKTGFTEYEFLYLALRDGMELKINTGDAALYLQTLINNNELLSEWINEEEYFYTREAAEREKNIYREIHSGKGQCQGVQKSTIDANLKQLESEAGIKFTKDQKEAVRFFSNNDRFFAIQGDAGTGKTRSLLALKHIFENEGWEVKGLCFTGKGSENIFVQAGIPSNTIHRFMNELEWQSGNYPGKIDFKLKKEWYFDGLEASKRKEIWVIDESSMISNRLMTTVIDAAKRRNAKVLFTGDYKQLQSIGAGAVFDKLINRNIIAHTEIKENVRHRNASNELKTAIEHTIKGYTNDLFFGDPKEVYKSLEAIKEKNKIVRIKDIKIGKKLVDRTPRLIALSKKFVDLPIDQRENTFILTSQNNDREYFNNKVREILKEKGEIEIGNEYSIKGKDGKEHKREFAKGDKIIFLNNATLFDKYVTNGTLGKIEKIKDNMFYVNVRGETVKFDIRNYNNIDHGYSITVHKSQGVTIPEKVFYHLDVFQKQSNYLNSFYVALTRSSSEIEIYTNGDLEQMADVLSKKQYKFSILDSNEIEPKFYEETFEIDEFDKKRDFSDGINICL